MKVRDMKKDQTNFVWSIRNLYILQVRIAVRICQIMMSLQFDHFLVENLEGSFTHFSFGKTAHYSLIIFW